MDGGWIDLKKRLPRKADGVVLVWHVFQGVMIARWDDAPDNCFFSHWRPMPVSGWVESRERWPTAQDGDTENCVLTRHMYDGYRVTGWHQFAWDPYFTHWMRTPAGPEGFEALRDRL